MALIECKHCGQKISDKAAECPHCGEKVEAAGSPAKRVCEECGAALEEGMNACPVCGCPAGTADQEGRSGIGLQPETPAEKKKTGKAKYIVIGAVLLVLVIFGIAACGGSGDEAGQNDGTAGAAVSEDAGTEENGAGDTTAGDADAQATAAQLYQLIAENVNDPFTISEASIAFIDAHPEFFPGNAKNQGAISDYVDIEVNYQHVAKAPSKYQDTLMSISGDVIDIEEIDMDGQTVTAFQLYDYNGKSYVVYHLGALENVFEDSWVWAYVLPFDMTSFENLGGGYTEAIVCGSCYVGGDAEVTE